MHFVKTMKKDIDARNHQVHLKMIAGILKQKTNLFQLGTLQIN